MSSLFLSWILFMFFAPFIYPYSLKPLNNKWNWRKRCSIMFNISYLSTFFVLFLILVRSVQVLEKAYLLTEWFDLRWSKWHLRWQFHEAEVHFQIIKTTFAKKTMIFMVPRKKAFPRPARSNQNWPQALTVKRSTTLYLFDPACLFLVTTFP